MLGVENWMRRFIPFAVHGDGVRFSQKGDNLLVLSMSFLLCSSWSWASISMMACFTKVNRCYQKLHGADTWKIIWKYVCLGFQALMTGIHPPTDPYGAEWKSERLKSLASKPVCGGWYRGCIWALPCDGEFAANELGCANASSNQMCTWCPANVSTHNFKDVSPNANWKRECYTCGPTDTPVSNHELWHSGLGVSRFTYTGDWMHTGDLGVLPHLFASTILDMIGDGVDEGCITTGSKAAKLEIAWSWIQDEYELCGTEVRLHNLKPSMVGGGKKITGSGPVLSAKAAESRHLLKPMLELLRKRMATTLLSKHRICAFECLIIIYDIIMHASFVLTDGEAEAVRVAADGFLLHYNVLAKAAADWDIRLYGFVPKHHWFWHMAQWAKYLNPRLVWCYPYEDFVGRVQRSASSCKHGTPMWKVPGKAMQNFSHVLSYTLQGYSPAGRRK